MTDQEMINALQTILKPIDKKLDDLNYRIDGLNLKMDELQIQINSVRLELKTTERTLGKEIRDLQDGQETLIAVLEAKGILPKIVE